MLAQTWSKEIAEKFGEAMGARFADIDNYGWYGPAMDTHRSAFGGRNFGIIQKMACLAVTLVLLELMVQQQRCLCISEAFCIK